MTITLYTTPRCSQCRMTKLKLGKLGLAYTTVDLSKSPMDMAAVKELGYSQAPVVIAHIDGLDLHWSGFRPDMLDEIAARLNRAEATA